MVLFKAKGFPIILQDLSNMVHYSSCNTAVALKYLHVLIREDPPGYDLDLIMSVLSESIWIGGSSRYSSDGIKYFTEKIGLTELIENPGDSTSPSYWEVYAYIYSLIPVLVWRYKIYGERWTKDEYARLEQACYDPWFNEFGREKDHMILDSYIQMKAASESWFLKDTNINKAYERCMPNNIKAIQRVFPSIGASIRTQAFLHAIEEFLFLVFKSLRSELRIYWMQSKSFLESSGRPLPRPIDPEAYDEWLDGLGST